MHSSTRVLATACALLMVFLAFNSVGVRASPPTSDNELNHSLASNGGSASSSGFSGVNGHANAIDGSTSTYWQSSTTTGWIAVAFSPRAYVNEVHIHFLSGSTIYPGLSLYLDTNANGAFETGEKLWSTTTNSVRDVVASVVVSFASGMKVTIDLPRERINPRLLNWRRTSAAIPTVTVSRKTKKRARATSKNPPAGAYPSTLPTI